MQTGGPSYAVELGRLDGRISTKASVHHHLPHPEHRLDQLKTMFASHGLALTHLIALSGTLFYFFLSFTLINLFQLFTMTVLSNWSSFF